MFWWWPFWRRTRKYGEQTIASSNRGKSEGDTKATPEDLTAMERANDIMMKRTIVELAKMFVRLSRL